MRRLAARLSAGLLALGLTACLDYDALVTGARDLSASVDQGGGDLEGADLAGADLSGEPRPEDLAGADLAGADLSPMDLAAPDLAGPRHVFLLGARTGAIGNQATVDALCETAAAPTALGGRRFRGLLQYGAVDLKTSVSLGGRGTIVLPGGQLVSADSAAGFWGSHSGAIDQHANGAANTAVCVWTGFAETGSSVGNANICNEWANGAPNVQGQDGSPSSPTFWAKTGTAIGCDTACHVYCLEQ
jgi:uncharacterized protein YjbI with pentapeptide repeats